MADAFAPTAEFSIAQEQPVAGVENRATETAVRGLTNLFGNLSRTGGGSSKGPQPDPLMADFLEQMGVIEAQRASGQSVKATMNERTLVANYLRAGGDLDDVKSGVEAMTGRPFEYFGQTEGQRQFDAVKQTPEFQTAYNAARFNDPNLEEDEYVSIALASAEEQAYAADTLNRIASGQKLNWETRAQPAYTTMIKTFKEGAIAGLMEIMSNGGTLTPDEVVQTKLKWEAVKGEMKKPEHVTEAQWQSIDSQTKAIDAMFVTMEKLASKEHAINNLMSTYIAAAQSGGDGKMSLPEFIGVLTVYNDPSIFYTVPESAGGLNPIKTVGMLAGRTENGLKVQDAARSIRQEISDANPVPTDPNVVVVPDGNVVLNQVPEQLGAYDRMEKGETVGNIEASIGTISSTTEQKINEGNGAHLDLADAYSMAGAGMMGAERFMSAAKIKAIVGTPEATNRMLDAISRIDSEAAVEARVMLRSGLKAQLNMLKANERTTMEGMKVEWDPEKRQYFFPADDPKAARLAEQKYSGVMTDSGFYLDNNQPLTNTTIAPQYWNDLMDRRAAIDAATKAFEGLALPQEDPPEQVKSDSIDDPSSAAFENYIQSTIMSESSNNPLAKNPNSSALGLAQFLEGTWKYLMNKYPDLGLTEDGRTDEDQSLRALRRFTEENMSTLKSYGVEITEGSLYAAHFLGATGASEVYNSVGDELISDIVPPKTVRDNPFLAKMTVADFKDWSRKKGTKVQEENAQFATNAVETVMGAKPDDEIVTTALGPAAPTIEAPEGAATDTGVQTFETEGDFLQAVMDDKVMNGESIMVAGELTTFEDAVGASNLGNQGEQLVVPDPETSPMGPDGEDQPKREAAKPEPKYKKLRDLPVTRRDALIQEIYAVGGNSDTKVFEDINDVMDAIFAGEVKEGDVIVVGGRVQVLAYEDK